MSQNTLFLSYFNVLKKIIKDTLEKAKKSLDSSIGTQVQILHLGAGIPGSKPLLSRNYTIHIPGKNLVPSIRYQ